MVKNRSNINIAQVASASQLGLAYRWLCEKRKNYSHNNDVWHLRWAWHIIKPQLQGLLRAGKYRFNPQHKLRINGKVITIWEAQDALVLKAVALTLHAALPRATKQKCYHLAGNGGVKGAVRGILRESSQYDFVFRSDVKGYYANMTHNVLLHQLSQLGCDVKTLALVSRFLHRSIEEGGEFLDITRGISRGCPLSPGLGALYLAALDEAMLNNQHVFYARFMDDWIVMAKTRWHLRKAIKQNNQILTEINAKKHPDKTSIGTVQQGFDFLGYSFSPGKLGIAEQTLRRCILKITRLYEQGANLERIGIYLRRWLRWVTEGLE